MKKVSVIIPCYNVDSYLERCWESLKRQTLGMEDLECIFVNDASTDNGHTLSQLTRIEEEYPESVMIVNLSENGGPGNARNIALEYASAEYFQFLDADDELREDTCLKLYTLATENNADIIQFNHLYILGDRKRSSSNSKENRLYMIKDHNDRTAFLNATLVTYGCTNKFYRTDLVKKAQVSFPVGLRYEEPLFVYPLFLYADRVYLLNDELYFYYFREGSMVTSLLGKRILDHPRVQLMLLEDLMSRGSLFDEYKDVIELYFLWSFYCETISFASENEDAVLTLDFFSYMQEVCRTFFPGWKDNPYLKQLSEGGRTLLSTIDITFGSDAELAQFIKKARGLI